MKISEIVARFSANGHPVRHTTRDSSHPQLGSYSGNLTVTQSFDGALAEVDNEPTVILVGTNGIALQWGTDTDPEEVRSGVEYVREVARKRGRTLLNIPPFLSPS